MKRGIIIGLAGVAGSGKDTAATMISYIYKHGSAANYAKWLQYHAIVKKYPNIVHFADNVKECLSIIYDIPLEYFNNRMYKDEYFYVLNEKRFIDYTTANKEYLIIENSDLMHEPLSEHIFRKPKCCIKLRTLMQYFATDICRYHLSDDIWIKSAIWKAISTLDITDVGIIADVRFQNEASYIKNKQNGIIIKLTRNTTKLNHSSEKINFECDYEIENNGSLQQLYYKILEIIQKL